MAKLRRTMECGCIIGLDYDNTLQILYCPKHKAAPDLYEALKDYQSLHETINQLMTHPNDSQILGELDGKSDALGALVEQALAKAEGK